MEITQSYARPSAATQSADGMGFSFSTEASRPRVQLQATVRDSGAYARAMLALYEVVSGDARFQAKDHSDYQEWVQQRYLEELEATMGDRMRRQAEQREELNALRPQIRELQAKQRELMTRLDGDSYQGYGGPMWNARSRYWKWLKSRNFELWVILDPVVSVHPDAVIFEVFSRDESSYGRVTIPMEKLETQGETIFGTTNVDYSKRLADEVRRVRDYRPAQIGVGGEGVSLSTEAGTQLEKKIDLPPTWVRGFLQVQSAATLPGTDVTLSAATVADMLLALRQKRENKGPRSLKFKLVSGQEPTVEIEPWGIEVQESEHVYEGETTEIRIWGRRRLFVLEGMLAHAQSVRVRLLGSGMPSYWSVESQGHRFDLGLSGWTENDWSGAARFDTLASSKEATPGEVNLAADRLEAALQLTPQELSTRSDLSREAAAGALQTLCRQGRAMFDPLTGAYRWRQLLAFPAPESEEDRKLASAKRWIASGAASCREVTGDTNLGEFLERFRDKGLRLFSSRVKTTGGAFEPMVGLDVDGRAAFAQCTCGEFRRDKLRKGPCSHILTCSVLAGRLLSSGSGSATRFKDQLWVFTGALSLFTREAAEALIERGGGKTSGSVSKNTTVLVAGERAGSKLQKARELGVRVMTEVEFQALLENRVSDAPPPGAAVPSAPPQSAPIAPTPVAQPSAPAPSRQPFAGQKWVFTGMESFARAEAIAFVQRGGATTPDNVEDAQTTLVIGDIDTFPRERKIARARELGAQILTETEFNALRERIARGQ